MLLGTEEVTLTDLTDGIEQIQKIDKGVIWQYLEDLLPSVLNFALELVLAVLIYLIGKRLILFVRKILRKSLEHREVDVGVRQFLDSVLKYCLYFLLWLVILTLFGITTASVVAVLGSAGLTLGLALQGSLANFAGGVLILLMKPFQVGDYIIVDQKEGTVKEISTFYTKILTMDNQAVLIPNGKLSDSSIVNVSAQKMRRIDLVVGIGYSSDIRLAKQLLRELAEKEPRRLPDQPVEVFVSELNESSVDMGLRLWVNTPDYWQTRWDLQEAVKLTFDEHGIEIPFRQVDVNIRKD